MLPAITQQLELPGEVSGERLLRAFGEAADYVGEPGRNLLLFEDHRRIDERSRTHYLPRLSMKNGVKGEAPYVKLKVRSSISGDWWEFCVYDGKFHEPMTIVPDVAYSSLWLMSNWTTAITSSFLLETLATEIGWYANRVRDVLRRNH